MEMLIHSATKIAPNSTFSFVVSSDYGKGVRIDKFIADQFPFYSRSFFQHLIDDGLVGLNGQIVSKQSQLVKESDAVSITFPPEPKIKESDILHTIDQKHLDVEIVAEHEHFLIVYKPANLLVHRPSLRSKAVTLIDWLLLHYKELASVGHSDRPAIVHRLDKDTSGLLIIPRTPYAYKTFGEMFHDRMIDKTYHTIVQGNPPSVGSIDFSIGRNPFDKKKMAAFVVSDDQVKEPADSPRVYAARLADEKGKRIRSSLTHYKCVEYFDDCALVEVKLVTGRMHQIRVHFSAIGHPVVGDPVYGNKSKLIKRQALHATSISFTLDGKDYFFSKDAPNDFQQVLTKRQAGLHRI